MADNSARHGAHAASAPVSPDPRPWPSLAATGSPPPGDWHGHGVTIAGPHDATILHQGIVYRAGVAVAYRCPGCGDVHPYDIRDYDPERRLYVGRFCGREPRIVAQRARNNANRRAYYAAHPEYREREIARTSAARRASPPVPPPAPAPPATAEQIRAIHEDALRRAIARRRDAEGGGL